MIETRARIVSIRDGTAWVESTERSGCGTCHAKSLCGISGLGKFLSGRRRPVPLACPETLRPGDELVVAVEEADLLKAGLMAYLLPAVLAVLGAVLAATRGYGDTGAVAGMLAGCTAGLLIARFIGRDPRLRARRSTDPTPQGEAP